MKDITDELQARIDASARAGGGEVVGSIPEGLPSIGLPKISWDMIGSLISAAIALPEHTTFLARALKVLPQEIERQILADGCHCERSPAQLLAVLQDLTDIRALLKAGQAPQPPSLGQAIDRIAPALRALRHPDGGLALFNGGKEMESGLIDLALAQAGRATRGPSAMYQGGFQRIQAGKSVLIADCGVPAPPKLDRFAHAGTLSFEFSVGKDRMIVNCGAVPYAVGDWYDACRRTAAHSTLEIAETDSSELLATGLGHRPSKVEVSRQEGDRGQYLEASHDGYARPFGAIHLRRLFMSLNGEDIRGEDVIKAATPQPFTIRFHLHPAVKVEMKQDGEGVLLLLPSGPGWELRAAGARLALAESIYLGGTELRRSNQIVLTGMSDPDEPVKWAITKATQRLL